MVSPERTAQENAALDTQLRNRIDSQRLAAGMTAGNEAVGGGEEKLNQLIRQKIRGQR